jgi:hypothetical protein
MGVYTDDIIGIPANRQLSKDIYETRRTLSNINPAMAAAPIIKSFTDEHGHQLKELLPTSPRAFETLGERAKEREIKSPMLSYLHVEKYSPLAFSICAAASAY